MPFKLAGPSTLCKRALATAHHRFVPATLQVPHIRCYQKRPQPSTWRPDVFNTLKCHLMTIPNCALKLYRQSAFLPWNMQRELSTHAIGRATQQLGYRCGMESAADYRPPALRARCPRPQFPALPFDPFPLRASGLFSRLGVGKQQRPTFFWRGPSAVGIGGGKRGSRRRGCYHDAY